MRQHEPVSDLTNIEGPHVGPPPIIVNEVGRRSDKSVEVRQRGLAVLIDEIAHTIDDIVCIGASVENDLVTLRLRVACRPSVTPFSGTISVTFWARIPRVIGI